MLSALRKCCLLSANVVCCWKRHLLRADDMCCLLSANVVCCEQMSSALRKGCLLWANMVCYKQTLSVCCKQMSSAVSSEQVLSALRKCHLPCVNADYSTLIASAMHICDLFQLNVACSIQMSSALYKYCLLYKISSALYKCRLLYTNVVCCAGNWLKLSSFHWVSTIPTVRAAFLN